MGSANSQCSKPRLVDDSLGDKKLPNILDIIIIHELRIRFLTNQYNGMTEGFEHCVKSQSSQIHIRAGGKNAGAMGRVTRWRGSSSRRFFPS